MSTTQTRHTPTGVSFCWWHNVGMGMPWTRAASKIVVPCGTDTDVSSIVSCTCFAGTDLTDTTASIVILFSGLIEADPSGAAAPDDVFFYDARKMFHHRGDGDWHNLSKSANGCLPHSRRKLFQDLHVFRRTLPCSPAF